MNRLYVEGEHFRRANPMDFEEAASGFVSAGSDDAPLRIFVTGDEEEITRACVNEERCWNCHENFPAPLGMINWPAWVASGWGNPTEDAYADRRRMVQNNCCPMCTSPSAPQIILEEIAKGKAHMAEGPPDRE